MRLTASPFLKAAADKDGARLGVACAGGDGVAAGDGGGDEI